MSKAKRKDLFMKAKKKIGLLVLGFSSIATLASCGEKPHVHEFIDHEEVFPNCADTGTEAYKTCTGCDKIFNSDGEEIAAPTTIPVDPNDHKGTKEMVVSGTFKTAYVVGDTFDIDNAVFTIKCEHCAGSALSKAKKEKIKVTYPTEGATSFTVADLSAESLKINFEYSDLKASANVTLSKKTNAIEGLGPISKYCGFKPFTELEGVTSTFGTIVYTFSDAENGEYKTAEQLGADYYFMNDPTSTASKTYYVKATVEDGEDYLGASASATITINHNEGTWNTEDEDKDTFGCVCQDPIVFNKKTSGNQDIVLSEETNSINLEGTSYDSTKDEIKSIKYVVDENTIYDLGKDIANLDVAVLKEHPEHHNIATLDIIISTPVDGITPAFDHHVSAEVTFVTAKIATIDDFTTYVSPFSATSTDGKTAYVDANKLGYYKLTADLDANGQIKYSSADAKAGYFAGTFDGCGHKIKSPSNANHGLFSNLRFATIKNLTVEDTWHNDDGYVCTFARHVYQTTLDNVTVKLAVGNSAVTAEGYTPTCKSYYGWISWHTFQANTLKNCTFDASGFKLGSLFGWNLSMTMPTVTNCVVKAKSLTQAMYSQYLADKGDAATFQPENATLKEGEVAIPGLNFIEA